MHVRGTLGTLEPLQSLLCELICVLRLHKPIRNRGINLAAIEESLGRKHRHTMHAVQTNEQNVFLLFLLRFCWFLLRCCCFAIGCARLSVLLLLVFCCFCFVVIVFHYQLTKPARGQGETRQAIAITGCYRLALRRP